MTLAVGGMVSGLGVTLINRLFPVLPVKSAPSALCSGPRTPGLWVPRCVLNARRT